jgi:hypothetical protein
MLPPFITRWLQPGWDRLKVGEHSGIGLLDTSRAGHARQDFISRTTEALDLVARVDPKRFKRIRAHIKYIVHHELPHEWAKYDNDFQWCFVDFTQLDFSKDPELAIWGYGAALVHESTHGRIHSFRIPYSRKTRERIERLCDIEAARFLLHQSPEASEAWNSVMNTPEGHAELWSKPWYQRLGAYWNRRRRRTNPQGRANGRQPFRSETSRTSAAAASRRSP